MEIVSAADPLHDLPLIEMLDAQLVRRAEWEYPGLAALAQSQR